MYEQEEFEKMLDKGDEDEDEVDVPIPPQKKKQGTPLQ